MDRARTTVQVFGALLATTWWAGLVLIPLQLVLAVARATGAVGPAFADMNQSVRVLGQVPGTAEGWAWFAVELTRLPAGQAVVVALLQAGAAAVWLPVVRQLHGLARQAPAEPFDHSVMRRVRRVGVLGALAGVATSVLVSASSWVAAAVAPVPGAEGEITIDAAFWSLVAAGVCVFLVEVLRRGIRLREDDELTV